MSGSGESLVNFIRDKRKEIANATSRVPYAFIRETFEQAADAFTAICDSIELLTERHSRDSPVLQDRFNRERYRQLIKHHALFQSIPKGAIPYDLYFLLKSIQDDFGLKSIPICLVEGREYQTTDPADYIAERDALQAPEIGGKKGREAIARIERANLHFVHLPTAHMDNPYAWPLISHECAHILPNLAKLEDSIPNFHSHVPSRKRDEVLADIVAINYLGPAYCQMVLEFPQIAGTGGSEAHPCAKSRWRIARAILRWYAKNRSPAQENIAPEIIANLVDSIDQALDQNPVQIRDENIVDYVESQIDDLQESIVSFMVESEIPLWDDRLADEVRKSQLANNSDLTTKLMKNRIILALAPAAVFNLGLYAEKRGVSRSALGEAILHSFRRYTLKMSYAQALLKTDA